MKLKREQQGMTLMGMIMVLAVVGFFIYCGMKVVPMYSEFSGVKEAMEAVAQEPNIANSSKGKIIELLNRRFNISYVENVKPEHITLDTKKGAKLSVNYEVRVPLMYNLDVVGKFEYMVDLKAE